MTVLPDTSIWVEYLRRGKAGDAAHLDTLLQSGEVLACGPVVAELLAGTRPPDRDDLWLLLRSLPWARLGRDEWRRVGQVAGDLRDHRLTVPLTDIEIAVSAVSASAALWTQDEDFRRVATALTELRFYTLS